MNLNTVIDLIDVHKAFKDHKAINGISLQIREGEFIALLGPNGAGKTTLVEMIEGIQKPDSGTIQLFGKDWAHNEKELRGYLGFSLQETQFIEKLSVLETMQLFSSFYSQPTSKCKEILSLTGLGEKLNAYVENLSGGQRQKLALAIGLVNEPRLLILDEPTTGLDPTARREIWDILSNLKKKSTTMILTTHYMEEAEKLCERILFLDKGQILAQGTLDELLEEKSLGEHVDFSVKEKLSDIQWEKFHGFRNIFWKTEGYVGRIHVDDIVGFVPEFFQIIKERGITLLEFESKKMTLDDLFLSMTGRSLED
ncbi:MAG: ABC transporter ATP-binding protein [Leptospiraceae bacterium]|nr:ABC transporter ATP-binding protein [Leptospiraceae bacterium]